MDKVIHGRGTHICPPAPHRFIICMKPATCCYPLCLMCSSLYNLCRSHTLPFCPTSNHYSHFIPLTPHSFHASLFQPSASHRCGKTAISGRPIIFLLLLSSHVSGYGVLLFPRVSAKSANSVMKLDCHLLPAGTSPLSLSLSCTAAAQTEQHCHLLRMQIQLTS